MNEFNCRDDCGFVLVTGLLLIVILTLIGVFATRTAILELQIAGNEKQAVQEFHLADGAWQRGVTWLDSKTVVPDSSNGGVEELDDDLLRVVRNYGDKSNDLNEDLADGSEDGEFIDGAFKYDTPHKLLYWFSVLEGSEAPTKVEGEGPNYARYTYDIEAVVNSRTRVSTKVTKVFKTGY